MSVQDPKVAARRDDLAKRMAKLLAGRSIVAVLRADKAEMVLELDDGTRVFARSTPAGLDISVT